MKCPICEKLGQKSSIIQGASTSTLAYNTPFWDEHGSYHKHDTNKQKQELTCSKGHNLIRTWISECSSCDFGKNSEIITEQNV